MKFTTAIAALPALAGMASAAYTKEDYASGKVHMDIMAEKEVRSVPAFYFKTSNC